MKMFLFSLEEPDPDYELEPDLTRVPVKCQIETFPIQPSGGAKRVGNWAEPGEVKEYTSARCSVSLCD